jgi:serine/threonine-protein kinase
VFLLTTLGWFCTAHFMPKLQVTAYFFVDLAFNLFLAAMIWLLYVALEPAVRARWPHSLVTWNRLLNGQFADARLGSHILMGVALGVAMLYLIAWRSHWEVVRGGPPEGPDPRMLFGLRSLIAIVVQTATNAITSGAIIFFVICGVRALVRRDVLALVISAALLALQSDIRDSANLALDLPIILLVFGAFAWALLRGGLVPAIAGLFTVNLTGRIAVAPDFGAWYNTNAALLTALVIGIALYGFWRSQSPAATPSPMR